MNHLLTVQDLAKYLRVNTKTIYRFLEKGDIPATRVGHLWRFDKLEIDFWLRQSTKSLNAQIMVIDDDEAICALFEETLRDTSYSLTSVQEPLEGIELIEKSNPDMVFLDLIMSGMDGAAVFKKIRAVKLELPVVIITGYPDSALMNQVLAIGPFTVIKKPFTGSEVLAVINSFLRFNRNVENAANR